MPAKETKKNYKDYSEKDIFAALTLLDFNGGNVNKTAKAIGVPESTLRKWKKERDAKTDEEKAEKSPQVEKFAGELSAQFEKSIRLSLAAGDQRLTGASLPEIREWLAVLTDKYQLLNNRPSVIQSLINQGGTKEDAIGMLFQIARERKETAENQQK